MSKRIVVLGAGESGSGAAILAKEKGFDVFVSDYGTISDPYRALLDQNGVKWEDGHHTEELILNADEVVKSPGIPLTAPLIQKLQAQGTPIISEIEFAARYTNAKMICITGSNGKTTTTSLIFYILKQAGLNVGLAGNSAYMRDGSDITYILVENTDRALGLLASKWFGEPSKALTLVGVTGTNGKTTIATLLYKLVRALGHKAGLLSTVVNYVDDEAVPATHTTPDAIELNGLLRRMVDAGCTYAFMEVSSHAIAQERIAGLDFDGALFTNLTRDHIDYHKTFDNYRDTKKRLFDGLKKKAFAVTNKDDKNGLVMTQNCKAAVHTYSTRSLADYKAQILEEGFDGMMLNINGKEVFVPLVGRFNVSNLLCIYGAAINLGFDEMEVLRVLSTLKPCEEYMQGAGAEGD